MLIFSGGFGISQVEVVCSRAQANGGKGPVFFPKPGVRIVTRVGVELSLGHRNKLGARTAHCLGYEEELPFKHYGGFAAHVTFFFFPAGVGQCTGFSLRSRPTF